MLKKKKNEQQLHKKNKNGIRLESFIPLKNLTVLFF